MLNPNLRKTETVKIGMPLQNTKSNFQLLSTTLKDLTGLGSLSSPSKDHSTCSSGSCFKRKLDMAWLFWFLW